MSPDLKQTFLLLLQKICSQIQKTNMGPTDISSKRIWLWLCTLWLGAKTTAEILFQLFYLSGISRFSYKWRNSFRFGSVHWVTDKMWLEQVKNFIQGCVCMCVCDGGVPSPYREAGGWKRRAGRVNVAQDVSEHTTQQTCTENNTPLPKNRWPQQSVQLLLQVIYSWGGTLFNKKYLTIGLALL